MLIIGKRTSKSLHDDILRHSGRYPLRVMSRIVILPNDDMGCARSETLASLHVCPLVYGEANQRPFYSLASVATKGSDSQNK